jgi:uncharacterized integral membrane protein (TIGR00698 family)
MSESKPGPAPGGVAPGLILVVLVGVAAHLLHGLLPRGIGAALGEVIFAVLLGLAAGNAIRLPASASPGIRFAFQTLLRLAIVLLGAGFSFLSAVAIGGKALGMVAALMVLALAVAHGLGRLAAVHDKLATLIGVGTAVCGNSAISATAPVIGASDEDMAFAIATNTLFGTLAVFAYPLLGHALGLSDAAFGTWAGTAVNDTSQVVATGFAYSDAAGKIATVVKLTRNALMGVVIVTLGLIYRRRQEGAGVASGFGSRLRQSVPIFVVGFLAMAVLNTLGVFAWISARTGGDVSGILQSAARWLILFALAGVGLGTRLTAMRRTGLRPFYVGLATAACTSVASYLLILLLGPAGM